MRTTAVAQCNLETHLAVAQCTFNLWKMIIGLIRELRSMQPTVIYEKVLVYLARLREGQERRSRRNVLDGKSLGKGVVNYLMVPKWLTDY